MKTKVLKITGVLLLFCVSVVNAATVRTKGADFLKFIPDARTSAMGGAAVASSPEGTESLYWNPAINAKYQHNEVQISYIKWWDDAKYGYIGLAFGKIGINATFLRRDKFVVIDSTDNLKNKSFISSDLAIGISYSLLMDEDLAIGIVAKYIRRELDKTATAFASDLAVLYSMPAIDGLRFAASVQNMGSKIGLGEEKDNLPLSFRIGTAYSPIFLLGFTGALDLIKPIDASMNVSYGIEVYPVELYSWLTMSDAVYRTPGDLPEDIIAIRIGHDGSLTNLFEGLSGGFGIKFSRLKLNYAFKPYSEINDAHRLSLVVVF